jgi:peptide/nickel transport system substrate-binding protein
MSLRRLILTAGVSVLLTQAAMAQTIKIGLNDDPDQLDPALSRAASGRTVLTTFCGKLFDVSPDLKIIPMLATGFEWSGDSKALLVKLRTGLKFDDGETLDADAVKYNIDRNLTIPGSLRKSELLGVTSVDVVDPLTVRFNLANPNATLPSVLADRAGMMVSPKAGKALGENLGSNPSCSGPFKFVSRVAQGRMIFEKNPGYFDADKVSIQRVEFLAVNDSTVRLANLQSGQFDMIANVSPTDLETIKKDSRLKLAVAPDLGFGYIQFNINAGPRSEVLKDPRLREAIDLSIDREALVKVAFDNNFIAGNQYVGPTSFAFMKDVPVLKRDVAKAKELLKAAGKPNLTFKLITRPDRDFQIPAQIIQAMLKESGIDMVIDTQENVTGLANGAKGDFEALFSFWSGRVDPDGNVALYAHTQGSANSSKYSDPEMDKLIIQGRQETDQAKRAQIYRQIQQKMLKDRPLISVWYRQIFIAHSAKVQGFVGHSDSLMRLVGVKL